MSLKIPNSNKTLFSLFAPCLILSSGAFADNGLSTPIKVEGHLVYTLYSQTETIQSVLKVQFAATLNNGGWNIVTLYSETGTVQEAGYDGTNIFQVLRPPPSYTATNKLGLAGTILKEGAYPEWMHPCGKVVWLAFASSGYLDRVKNAPMPFPWLGNFGGLHRNDVMRSEKEPRLPLAIVFWGGETNAGTKGTAATPFIEGDYSVVRTTNVSFGVECELPIEFEVKRYWPPQNRPMASQKSTSSVLYNAFVGKVTNIAAVEITRVLPALTGRVYVNDRRYFDPSGTVSHIQYAITNDDWPARDQPELQANLNRSIIEARNNLAAKKPTTIRWFYLALLMAIFASPVAMFLIQKQRNRNKSSGQRQN